MISRLWAEDGFTMVKISILRLECLKWKKDWWLETSFFFVTVVLGSNIGYHIAFNLVMVF